MGRPLDAFWLLLFEPVSVTQHHLGFLPRPFMTINLNLFFRKVAIYLVARYCLLLNK